MADGVHVTSSTHHHSTCTSRWVDRVPRGCCRKGILMLLAWKLMFGFPRLLIMRALEILFTDLNAVHYFSVAVSLGTLLMAPFFVWLADVKLGRYRTIMYGALSMFVSAVLFSAALLANGVVGKVLTILAMPLQSFGAVCSTVVMLPFMTDQLVVTGASSNELSAVVYWFYWVETVVQGTNMFMWCRHRIMPTLAYNVVVTGISVLTMSVVIFSDCLCQQWLYTAHKITNPIKLIVQVLNYARKHSYPVRRSAFTYNDEEHPSRIDYGKEKFGGPFLEVEVEDVKTVLRMLPLLACVGVAVGVSPWTPVVVDPAVIQDPYWMCVVGSSVTWLSPLIFVPVYQHLIYPLFHQCILGLLWRLGFNMFVFVISFAACVLVYACLHHPNCGIASSDPVPGVTLGWYWSVAPLLVYCISRAMVLILLLEFCIAQSPDKMKGLVIGAKVTFAAVGEGISVIFRSFLDRTVHLSITSVLLALMFVVYLALSRSYKFRVWNIVVNIMAIVTRTYDRYFDQEEEYMRERAMLLRVQ